MLAHTVLRLVVEVRVVARTTPEQTALTLSLRKLLGVLQRQSEAVVVVGDMLVGLMVVPVVVAVQIQALAVARPVAEHKVTPTV